MLVYMRTWLRTGLPWEIWWMDLEARGAVVGVGEGVSEGARGALG